MSMHGSLTFVPSVHFSPTHRRRVRETIRDVDPDLVAVELDDRRYDRIEGTRRPGDVLSDALPPATAAAYNVLRTIQRTIVRFYGLDPGETDMEAAIETAAELETAVALIDEPIGEIIDALTSRVGPELVPKLFVRAQRLDPSQQARQIELLTLPLQDVTSGEDVQPAIEQLRLLCPEVTDVLIDRRDRAMARRLHALRREGHDVVVVIGAGHHLGIEERLADLESTESGDSEATHDETVSVPIRSPSRDVTRIPID
ncbi:TraB/GumN family protein [Natronolimnohabitans sp. A-GB9]|uniref:TraB domain-containing protein n=1 Tax=Natronolimnohabitans sp. A-GB9 TaxID=3069757 RepID=UPI0027B47E6C|nr:TraB/GumN family protein [Natronolimnohabitans sp. A-GB9]MDQ2051274.1 TraB/GumN family protein [Natronolimnohabitans sp. A-GB9]